MLDRALEWLPLFRLSDSAADEGALQFAVAPGARWRVLPAPGDRLPGTFDQDVYVGLLHRWTEAGRPDDGAITLRVVRPAPELLDAHAASPERRDWWLDRLRRVHAVLAASAAP